MTEEERERALGSPDTCFARPSDVLELRDCSDEDKIAILLSWQRLLIQLQIASDENMLREEPGRSNVAEPLADVTKALAALGHSADAGTTHGSI